MIVLLITLLTDIVLVWPHKSSFLERGQIKESQRRNAVSWNGTLANNSLDMRLLVIL